MRQAEGRMGLGRIVSLVLLGAAIMGIFVNRAGAAVVMGPYLDVSSGSGTFEWDSDNYEFDVDSGSAAIGFALDSTRGEYANFNYRLNVGFEGQNLEDEYGATIEMGGIVCENVFGFTLVRERGFRWWAGPLVRIGFYSGETDEEYNYYGDRYKTEVDLFEFGVGVATGINVWVAPHTYFAPSAGIRFIGASGSGTVKNYDLRTQHDDDLSGSTANLFLNLTLLFD